jgi:MFS family permease
MRNVKLLYIARALYFTWFWLGIWVIYYKQFGGFAAVGLLETVMVFTSILFEIPTGAIGDLLGKRKTLLFGFFFAGVSQIWMGFAPNLPQIVLSLVVMNIGGALISGTFEAMLYDSLKTEGKEQEYGKVTANVNSIRLIALAVSGIVGGFMYRAYDFLPYLLNGIGVLSGMIFIFMTKEPAIDTEKFSFKAYLKQNVVGFQQLYRVQNKSFMRIIFLTVISVVLLILWEGANGMYMTSLGFSEVTLGIFSAALALIGAVISYKYSLFEGFMQKKYGVTLLLVLYATSLLLSPVVGAFMGAAMLSFRAALSPLLDTKIRVEVNEHIESKYRATTLSTFSMVTQLPYLFLIYGVGVLSDSLPVSYVLAGLGGLLVFLVVMSVGYGVKRNRNIEKVT